MAFRIWTEDEQLFALPMSCVADAEAHNLFWEFSGRDVAPKEQGKFTVTPAGALVFRVRVVPEKKR